MSVSKTVSVSVIVARVLLRSVLVDGVVNVSTLVLLVVVTSVVVVHQVLVDGTVSVVSKSDVST